LVLSDLPTAILVGIALVLGGGAFAGARAVGERLAWLPAGGIILIALTPLVPRVQIGLGFSLDDVLPIVGLAMLIPAARLSEPSAAMVRSRRVILAIAIGLACLVLAGFLSALLNGEEPTRFVRFLARSSGRFLFLAAIAIVLARVISQRPGATTLSARALAVMGTVEAVFGLVKPCSAWSRSSCHCRTQSVSPGLDRNRCCSTKSRGGSPARSGSHRTSRGPC
jgi:hypothetical protein